MRLWGQRAFQPPSLPLLPSRTRRFARNHGTRIASLHKYQNLARNSQTSPPIEISFWTTHPCCFCVHEVRWSWQRTVHKYNSDGRQRCHPDSRRVAGSHWFCTKSRSHPINHSIGSQVYRLFPAGKLVSRSLRQQHKASGRYFIVLF